jgi:hypothetical protein
VTRYVRGPLTSKAPAATSLSPHTLTVTPAAGGGPPAVRSLTPTADMTVDVDLAPAPAPIESGVRRLIVTSGPSFAVFTNF